MTLLHFFEEIDGYLSTKVRANLKWQVNQKPGREREDRFLALLTQISMLDISIPDRVERAFERPENQIIWLGSTNQEELRNQALSEVSRAILAFQVQDKARLKITQRESLSDALSRIHDQEINPYDHLEFLQTKQNITVDIVRGILLEEKRRIDNAPLTGPRSWEENSTFEQVFEIADDSILIIEESEELKEARKNVTQTIEILSGQPKTRSSNPPPDYISVCAAHRIDHSIAITEFHDFLLKMGSPTRHIKPEQIVKVLVMMEKIGALPNGWRID